MCFALLLLSAGLSSLLSSRKVRQNLRRRVGIPSTRERTAIPALFWRVLLALGQGAKPRNEAELSYVRRTLVQAGYRRADAPIILFGVKLCLTIGLPLLFVGLRPPGMRTLPTAYTMLLFVLLAITGFYAPSAWLRMSQQHRRQQIAASFPDALDLMVVCVEAGLGLDAAIHRVGEQIALSHKVLSEEFRLVNLGLRAGQSRQEALRSLALRTGLEDITSFVTLLIQTDRFGTSIASALRVHADAMRTKRQRRAEETAAKLPVKLLFPLIFFIFPSLFVVIVGPAGIQIFRALGAIGTR
jgi:tight adherence protein C